MKIVLNIEDKLYIKLTLLTTLTRLPMDALLKEAIWREANYAKPLMKKYMEEGFEKNS